MDDLSFWHTLDAWQQSLMAGTDRDWLLYTMLPARSRYYEQKRALFEGLRQQHLPYNWTPFVPLHEALIDLDEFFYTQLLSPYFTLSPHEISRRAQQVFNRIESVRQQFKD